MNKTPNYNLNLPEDSDFVEVSDLSENFEEIDRQLENNKKQAADSVSKSGDTMTGLLSFDIPGKTSAVRTPIEFKLGNADGDGLIIGAGGTTIIGAGEAAAAVAEAIPVMNVEDLYLVADGGIRLVVAYPDYQNRKEWLINGSGTLLPMADNALQIGSAANRVARVYANNYISHGDTDTTGMRMIAANAAKTPFIYRNANTFYIMISDTQMGWENGARPLQIDLNTGVCNINGSAATISSFGTANTRAGSNVMPNVTGQYNVAIGTTTLNEITSGSNNVAVGVNALTSLTTGSNNIAVGTGALGGGTPSQSVAIGTNAGAASNMTATRCIFIGNAANSQVPGTTSYSNSINIGTGSVAYPANNTISLGDDAITAIRCKVQAITALSDERAKTDIKLADTNLLIDALLAIPVKRFKMNEEITTRGIDEKKLGFIAQDVQKVFKRSVSSFGDVTKPVLDENGNQVMKKVKHKNKRMLTEDEIYRYREQNRKLPKNNIIVEEIEEEEPVYVTTLENALELTQDFVAPVVWGVCQHLVKENKALTDKVNDLEARLERMEALLAS